MIGLVSNETPTREWQEGREAFAAGMSDEDCPYDVVSQWGLWADWICGYGEAGDERPLPQQRDREGSA